MKVNNYEKVDAVLGVDAGNISVADVDYILSKGGKIGISATSEGKIIELTPGKYKVNILIAQTYRGRVNKTFNLETKGKVYVGDICYAFSARDNISNEAWGKVLSETNDLRTGNKNIGIADTGGDGSFGVLVTFEPAGQETKPKKLDTYLKKVQDEKKKK